MAVSRLRIAIEATLTVKLVLKMSLWKVCLALFAVVIHKHSKAYVHTKSFDCGPYGFICEGSTKLRLCEGDNLFGPAFKCPPNSVCNEDSSDVCENTRNYIDPAITRTLRCYRSERIADPYVPDCKGYILCIPNKNRFQGIKFQCTGNTIFNGYTRTCSSPDKYKCPIENTMKSSVAIYGNSNRRVDTDFDDSIYTITTPVDGPKPIECKNYKFSVTDDRSPVRAAYFCPSRPVYGEASVRCTVFSSKFCLTLEKEPEDQFIPKSGAAYRRPRM